MPLLRVEEQIAFLNNKCDAYHVDIMDGHFVPGITLSPTFVKSKCYRNIATRLSFNG